MSIEKKCETCSLDGRCLYQSIETNCIDGHYIPKEELVREDERNKILTLLNSDLETLDLSECDNILLNENSAVANYIKSVKELLEKEK